MEAQSGFKVKKSVILQGSGPVVVKKVQQEYQGVPVWGNTLVVHEAADGSLHSVEGTVLTELDRDFPQGLMAKALSRDDAIMVAMSHGSGPQVSQAKLENIQAKLWILQKGSGSARLFYLVLGP